LEVGTLLVEPLLQRLTLGTETPQLGILGQVSALIAGQLDTGGLKKLLGNIFLKKSIFPFISSNFN
jgi:hypothetical protein